MSTPTWLAWPFTQATAPLRPLAVGPGLRQAQPAGIAKGLGGLCDGVGRGVGVALGLGFTYGLKVASGLGVGVWRGA